MATTYQATYKDKFGEEITTIFNDGDSLKLTIRDVQFQGSSFELLTPILDQEPLPESFSLFLDALCDFELDCEIPVQVSINEQQFQTILFVHFEIGQADGSRQLTILRKKDDGSILESNTALNREVLQLKLQIDDKVYASSGQNLYATFDEQLIEIKSQLPDNIYLKSCWNCAYSDFLPTGSGQFGNLACFKNTKDEYKKVRNKKDLFQIWDQRAGFVQEIHVCPEFEKRQPGIGGLYVG